MKVFAAILLLSPLFVLPYLRGDGNGYYAWVRSPIIDGDLDFRNEFERGDPTFVKGVFEADGDILPRMITETHHVRNSWSVGPAVVWTPFFLVAHGGVSLARVLGIDVAADGFATPYLWLSAFATALAASVGLLLSLAVARTMSTTGAAVAGTVAIWLASPLPIYQYLLPFWPFGIAVLVSAVMVWVWRTPGWTVRRWLLLGLLSGFAAIVHPIGVTWVLLPIAALVGLDAGTGRERIRALPWFVVGGVIGAIPQLVGKAIVYGSPFESGHQAVEWRFTDPDFFRVLLGANHGTFAWTPVLALATIGLVFVVRRDRRLGLGLSLVLVAMVYLVASYGTYEQSSFGNRFLVWFTPGFVIGAAALADALWSKRAAVIAVVTALIVWNALFMFQWAWGLVPKRGPVDWGEMARQQFTDAPSEMVRAARLFFTDRSELVRIVQEQDIGNIEEGDA